MACSGRRESLGSASRARDNDQSGFDFDSDGTLYLGADDTILCRYDPASDELVELQTQTHQNLLTALELTPLGLVSGGYEDESLKLWDLQGGLIQVLQREGDVVQSLAFDPLSMSLVAGDMMGYVRIYDLSDLSAVKLVELAPEGIEEAEIFEFSVLDVAIGPEAAWLISLHDDGKVRFWSPNQGLLNQYPVKARVMALDAKGSRLWLNDGEQLVEYSLGLDD